MRWQLLCLCFMLMVLLPGCDLPGQEAQLPVNFSIGWQTGVVILLAYLANSQNHLAGLGQMALKLARQFRLVPTADDKISLDAEEVGKRLAQLYVDLKGHPDMQAALLSLMHPNALPTPKEQKEPS